MPLVSLLLTLTYFTPCSSVCIVNFEQVNAGWLEGTELYLFLSVAWPHSEDIISIFLNLLPEFGDYTPY